MENSNGIRLLIADPTPLLREALAALCTHCGNFEVVSLCADGASAFRAAMEIKPDVALLDLDLPEIHTLELLRKLRDAGSETRMVLMSSRSDRKTIIEALRCGAQGFVLKNGSGQQLFDSLRQVREGGVYISPSVELDKIFAANRGGRRQDEDPVDSLSAREHQVFLMLVEGLRAKEIAARLAVSPKTIDTYRSSMMRKLDIHDVAGLVKFAIHRRLTPAPLPMIPLQTRAANGAE
ncbi:MAG: response regulator transcription factor [Acidobacteria bacterium]|nr:response regulator transcription factor [Acidobacteriota bacterium]